MFAHILVAWDGSPNAARAVEYGSAIALKFHSRMEIVSVARHVEHAETENERRASTDEARRFFEERSAAAVQSATSRGIVAKAIVIEGLHPAEAIVEKAHELGVDLIVVGRQGLSGVTRFLMGSTSDRIVQHARCPVLVIDERQ